MCDSRVDDTQLLTLDREILKSKINAVNLMSTLLRMSSMEVWAKELDTFVLLLFFTIFLHLNYDVVVHFRHVKWWLSVLCMRQMVELN